MTMTPSGGHECDCCGADVGNGGVLDCVIVSDLDPSAGAPRILHFCRDRPGPDGEPVRGCEHKLLNPATIRHYTETKENARG